MTDLYRLRKQLDSINSSWLSIEGQRRPDRTIDCECDRKHFWRCGTKYGRSGVIDNHEPPLRGLHMNLIRGLRRCPTEGRRAENNL